MVKGKTSPITGDKVQLVAARELFNRQSLAASLMLGASAVWIGTRFVLCEEAGGPKAHQEAARTAGFDDNSMGDDLDDETMDNARPYLIGKAAAVVNERKSAKYIVDEMVSEVVSWLGRGKIMAVRDSKL
ncbi:MAG: hypothetical protein Q9211_001094 [Gyalolechia sp. 1 TL-2023]